VNRIWRWADARMRKRLAPAGLAWPWWIPYGAFASAVAVGVQILVQRGALTSPGTDTILVGVALAPWLAEYVVGWVPPRWLFTALVVGGVVALVVRPAEFDFSPFLLVLLAGEIASTSGVLVATLAAAGAAGAMVGVELTASFDGSALWVAGIAAAWGFGTTTRSQLANQSTLAAKVAVDERQRIAREVHDVVAHSLSVTMLHLTGARRALETDRDVDEAVAALRDAERLGRQAMTDIRRTVGLLSPGAPGDHAPLPSALDVPALVDTFRGAGADVELVVVGDPEGVDGATGLGLYRIVQESLANAAKHAPGASTTVRIDVADDAVTATVHTAGANGFASNGESGGLGLSGMEARAGQLGGTFRAGHDAGGWTVEVRLPRETLIP